MDSPINGAGGGGAGDLEFLEFGALRGCALFTQVSKEAALKDSVRILKKVFEGFSNFGVRLGEGSGFTPFPRPSR